MNASVTSPRHSPFQEDIKLQLLQLQCIIDAKDREIQLLRKQLSSPEESDEKVALLAEVAKLRGEVQQLALERNALRLQPAAAAARNDGTIAAQAKQTLGSGSQQQSASMAGPASNPFAHTHAGGAGANPAVVATLTDVKGQPASPAALQTVDSGALVEKLRALVTGLVAEALAGQQQRTTGPCPPTPFLTQQQQQQQQQQPQQQQTQSHGALPFAANSPYAGGHSRQPPGGHPVVAAHPSVRPTWNEAGQQVPPPQVAVEPATPAPFATVPAYATVASDGLTGTPMARGAWPGVHIIVPHLPSMLLQPTIAISWEALTGAAVYGPNMYGPNGPPAGPAIAGAAAGLATGGSPPPPPPLPSNPIGRSNGTSGTRVTVTTTAGSNVKHTAAAAAATHIGCNADGGAAAATNTAPAVLELNVDGTVVLVERAVLESEAAGSRLYRTLIQEYGKLPLDSQGRPYLSYEPRTFNLLISHLKERHLFGRTAAARDIWRMAEALGLPRQYVAQMASHFVLADDLIGPPPPQAFDPVIEVTSQQQQQQSSNTPQPLPPASAPRVGSLPASHLHTAPPPDSQDTARTTLSAHPSGSLPKQAGPAAAAAADGVRLFSTGRPMVQSSCGVSEQAGAAGGGGFQDGGFQVIPFGLSVGQPWDHLPNLRVLPPQQYGVNGNGTVVCGGRSPWAPSTEAVQLPLTNGVNGCSGGGGGNVHPDAGMSAAPAAGSAPLKMRTAATAALDATTPIEATSGNGNGSDSSLDVRANGVSGTGSGSVSSPSAEPTTASPFASGTSSHPQAQQIQQLQPPTVATPNRLPLTSSPSRIPPPPQPLPPLHRPAPAPPASADTTIPAADAATATTVAAADTIAAPESAAAAAAAGRGNGDGSPHALLVASPPRWWQPFNEDAAPAAAALQRELDNTVPIPDSAAAAAPGPAPTAFGPAALAAPAAGVVAPANVAPDAAAVPTAHAAATWPVSTAAAMAAAAERYRVPNMYEILAKKQRLELESEAGKIA
ncbi:hypothetical protein VaNZ11_015172 [Volvox africanus]|uniref:Uncharacterized protein n=1 Tax=Volvox africanus TaxID=51714 RepID=A0ABQ5SL88_9CHLO|nr:hypothetical protein VaNZ11_015172 [Volvox africanus]